MLIDILEPRVKMPVREDTSFKETPGLNQAVKFVITRTDIASVLEEEDRSVLRALIEASNRVMLMKHLDLNKPDCPQCQSKNVSMHDGDLTCRDCGMTATFEITFTRIPLGSDESDCNAAGDKFD